MIKKFENYTQYFDQIDIDDFNKSVYYQPNQDDTHNDKFRKNKVFCDENWVDFTDKEVEMINNQLPLSFKDNLIQHTSGLISYEEKRLAIIKTLDEWFYVKFLNLRTREYEQYKCDQLDGLLKFIKNVYLNTL